MKAVACLVAFALAVGYTVASGNGHNWATNKEYEYLYQGRQVAGIPGISNQFSTAYTRYKLIVEPESETVINLRIKDFEVITTNGKLKGDWRFLYNPAKNGNKEQLKSEVLQILQSPFKYTFENGVVTSMTVSSDTPTWAKNFFRGVAFTLGVNSAKSDVVVEGGNTFRPSSSTRFSSLFFRIREENIYGRCINYYTISEQDVLELVPVERKPVLQRQVPTESEENGSENDYHPRRRSESRRNGGRVQSRKSESQSQESDSSSSEEEKTKTKEQETLEEMKRKICKKGEKLFVVMQSVNFTECDKKAVLSYITPNVLNGRAGDNNVGSYMSRVVSAKTYGCGMNHADITIISVKVLEEHNFGQRVQQKTVAGTKLKLLLVDVRDKSSNKIQVQNAANVDSMIYKWDPISQKLQRQGLLQSGYSSHPQQNHRARENIQNNLQSEEITNVRVPQHRQVQSIFSSSNSDYLPNPPMEQPPLNPFLASPADTKEKLLRRYVELLGAAINDLNPAHSGRSQREIIGKFSASVKVLRWMSYSDIEEAFKKIQQEPFWTGNDSKEIAFQMFFDTVCIAGTNPAIKFLILKIDEQVLKGENAIQRIKMLPMYIRTPTVELLRFIHEKLVNRVDPKEIVQENDQLKTSIILAWSNLLRQVCVNSETKETRYPSALYGEMCTNDKLESEFFPFFKQLLATHLIAEKEPKYKHGIILALRSLGNLGHPIIIAPLQDVIEISDDVYIKSQAILSLEYVVKLRKQDINTSNQQFLPVDRRIPDVLTLQVIQHKVLPILVSIAFDRTLPYEVRLPAISLIFRCSATDRSILQQLARLTVYEKNFQVRIFIYTYLNNLAKMQNPTTNRLYKLRQAARGVIGLTAQVNGQVLGSNNIYIGEFNRFSEVAKHIHVEQYASRDSWMSFRYALETYISTGNGGTALHPFKVSLQGRSLHEFFSELYNALPWVEHPSIDKSTSTHLNMIAAAQLVKDRIQDKDMVANLLVNIQGQIQRLFTVDLDNLSYSKLEDMLNHLKESLSNINYHRFGHMSEYVIEIPSCGGIPMRVRYTKGAILSVRGKAQVEFASKSQWYKNIQLQAEFNTFVSVRSMEKVGFVLPYLGKKISTGIERHFASEPQFRVLARHTQQKIDIAITPAQLNPEETSSRIVLVNWHQRPYTLITTDSLLPSLDEKNTELKYVRTIQKDEATTERRFGESIGFPMIYKEVAEYSPYDERQANWFERWVKTLISPSRLISNQDVNAPSNRFYSQEIILDVNTAVTRRSRTWVFQFVTSKSSSNSMVPDHLRPQIESSEESSSSSESKEQNDSRKSSSSSSSSSSEEIPDRMEQLRFVLAVFGMEKVIPKLSSVKGVVEPLHLGYVSTAAVLNFKADSNNVKFTIALNEAAKKFAEQLPKAPGAVEIMEALKKFSDVDKRPTICIRMEGELKTPSHIKRSHQLTLRKVLLQNKDLRATVNGKMEYGSDCTQVSKTVKLTGTLKRSRDMYEWASSESRRAKNCERDENRSFFVSDDCLLNAREEAAALNEISLTLTSSSRFSPLYLNMTDSLMGMLYGEYHPFAKWNTHAQEGQQNTASLYFKMYPSKEFLDLEMMVENSKLVLDRVRTNRVIKRIFPLTATKNVFKNIHDRTLNYYAQPTCSLQMRSFNTFDNKTMTFDPEAVEGCYTVLTQDCSNKYQMAVLVRKLDRQILEFVVITNGNRVRIITQRVGKDYTVKINGAEVKSDELSKGKILYAPMAGTPGGRKPVGHVELTDQKDVQLQLIIYKTLTLVTEGRYVTVSLDNKFRNRVCGLCGNMDFDDSNDLVGPTNCPLSSANILYRAYGVPFPLVDEKKMEGKCTVPAQWKKDVEEPWLRQEAPCGRPRVCAEIIEAAIELIGERFRAAIQPCLWLEYAQHKKNEWVEIVKEHARKVLANTDCEKLADDAAKIAQDIFDKLTKESWWPRCVKIDFEIIIKLILEVMKVKP